MINIAECETDPNQLSISSLEAIEEIVRIINNSSLLIKITAIIPLFDIFLGNKSPPVNYIANTASFDWAEFTNVAKTIPVISRNQINKIADKQQWYTYGKEGNFWRCVYESTR